MRLICLQWATFFQISRANYEQVLRYSAIPARARSAGIRGIVSTNF